MFEMALAAATNLRADSSVSTAGLAAASIAAPCLLGSMAAEQQASSSPEVLLCAVGLTSSHTGIQLSSELAGVHPNQSHTHLSASAATLQNHSAPAKAFIGRGALPACFGSSSSQVLSITQRANVAKVEQVAGDGYNLHPAAVDSSLHLGAVASKKHNATSCVPVGLGAYCAQKPGEQPSSCMNSGHSGKTPWPIEFYIWYQVHIRLYMRQTSPGSDGGAGAELWAVAELPQVQGAPALDPAPALSSAWCLCGANSGSGMALRDLTSMPLALPAVSQFSHALQPLCKFVHIGCAVLREHLHEPNRQMHFFCRYTDKQRSLCRLGQSAMPLSRSRRTQSMKHSCRPPLLCQQDLKLHAYCMSAAPSACLSRVRLNT